MLNLCRIVRDRMKRPKLWRLLVSDNHVVISALLDCSQHQATLVDCKYEVVRALYYVSFFFIRMSAGLLDVIFTYTSCIAAYVISSVIVKKEQGRMKNLKSCQKEFIKICRFVSVVSFCSKMFGLSFSYQMFNLQASFTISLPISGIAFSQPTLSPPPRTPRPDFSL